MADKPRALKTIQNTVPPQPAKGSHAVLSVQSGPDAGRVLALSPKTPSTIGRAEECTFAFEDARLSREHVRIVRVNGEWMLIEAGSTNGTFVDGAKVEKFARLGDGSRLVLGGSLTLRFALVTEEEAAALARVYEAAMHDGLTGVLNRKALEERLSAEIAFAQRHGAELSVALVDIDHFKAVNDAHGHLVGDWVLCAVAAELGRTLRAEDVLGRYGGEEFLVVARGIPVGEAAVMAERLRAGIAARPVQQEGIVVPVTASFGVASLACCGATRDRETLLGLADGRLYAAKEGGRNRVVGAR